MFRAILELCRISNLPTVWTNVIAAWVVAGGREWRVELLWLLIGASLVYSAGMILNDTCDAAWDREKRPERPIPSGRIGLGTAWTIGIGGLVGGYLIMVRAGGANLVVTGLLLAAILIYDAYHKPWPGSVFIMGACRALVYASVALAAESSFPPSHSRLPGTRLDVAILAGVILGIYVVALTRIARAEGSGTMTKGRRISLTGILMVPAFWGLIGVSASTCSGTIWKFVLSVLTLAAFLLWTILALRQMSKGGRAIGEAVGLLLAGIPLVDALMIAPTSPVIALVFCCLPPLLRLWQRWIAAT